MKIFNTESSEEIDKIQNNIKTTALMVQKKKFWFIRAKPNLPLIKVQKTLDKAIDSTCTKK